jgi:hypothetical protein
MMPVRSLTPFVFGAGLMLVCASATAVPLPERSLAVAKCVYGTFKANAAVKSVEVYKVGDFRTAIEYTFSGKDKRELVGDLMLNGATYMVQAWHNESSADGFEELDFAMSTGFGSKCQLQPVGDHLLPPPPPRSEWQRADLGPASR